MPICRVRQLLLLPLCLVGIVILIHLEYIPPSRLGSNALIGEGSDLSFQGESLHSDSSTKDALSPEPPGELPTRFRESLSNDSSYITTWSGAGFTNQLMNYANMIYLGKLTDRIPIVPPFAPTAHVAQDSGIIPFGDIFDLEYLQKELKMKVLDWKSIKRLQPRDTPSPYNPEQIEQLGCWTTTRASHTDAVRSTNLVGHLGLDVSYTRVPPETRFPSSSPDELHVMFPQLAALIYPRDPLFRTEKMTVMAPSPTGHRLTPDTQLACFDSLYYVTSGVREFEWQRSWSPAWREVGRHLTFTREMQALARSYMTRAFGLPAGTEHIPPFIALHIRHGDFSGQCSKSGDDAKCFPPLSVYARHVDDIKSELAARLDMNISIVIVMSDDETPEFWDDVQAQGWLLINHTAEATVERFGNWYPPLIDAIVHSYAIGFVGTKGSTFSLVGERRVHDWNGGATREVSIRDNR
ncbi:hypothetical protein D9619_001469 [Psilocybe cf. subviscida]|uniref:Uncharacterized protein n=1 Tax=Psilocybe cf. subviscida TaxID=2480587 RepID=A0A8H5BGQ3_9AGAR|nr:hypothetical protein D9619_001469 [Psilocybe cf. subviscida]